jgi:hypothetical protein
MSIDVEKEIEAIGTLLKALGPLEPKARQSVLDYVIRRLDIPLPSTQVGAIPSKTSLPPSETPLIPRDLTEQVHIKDLVGEKKPSSAIEMATLIAYYLSHKAPQKDRKQTINTKDLEMYFKIGGFKLPTKPQFTLTNTKKAGYLESVGDGEYKLNPVGYNLVVHSMPKTSEQGTRRIQHKKLIKKPEQNTRKPKREKPSKRGAIQSK